MPREVVVANEGDEWDDHLKRIERVVVEAKAMTTTQRDGEIIRLVGLSLDGIVRAGAMLRVKEELGEDITALKLGSLASILLRVGHGSARPEIVQQFYGRLGFARKVSAYSPPVQDKIIKGGLPLVTYLGGARTVIKVDPAKVEDSEQLDQLFDKNGIRSEAQQMIYLDAKNKKATHPEPEKIGPIEIDRVRGVCIVKGIVITKETLLRVLEVLG